MLHHMQSCLVRGNLNLRFILMKIPNLLGSFSPVERQTTRLLFVDWLLTQKIHPMRHDKIPTETCQIFPILFLAIMMEV